jgi:hypothetical protein
VDVDADRQAARHILTDLGFVVRRSGDEVHGSATVVPPGGAQDAALAV